jgi:hypothetical protein
VASARSNVVEGGGESWLTLIRYRRAVAIVLALRMSQVNVTPGEPGAIRCGFN